MIINTQNLKMRFLARLSEQPISRISSTNTLLGWRHSHYMDVLHMEPFVTSAAFIFSVSHIQHLAQRWSLLWQNKHRDPSQSRREANLHHAA